MVRMDRRASIMLLLPALGVLTVTLVGQQDGSGGGESPTAVPLPSPPQRGRDERAEATTTAMITSPRVTYYCVLPVGDSLTQGVGAHGSYRAPLLRKLRRASVIDVRAAGTRRGPCVARNPWAFYLPDGGAPTLAEDGSLHEGYCSAQSELIRRRMEQLLLNPRSPRVGAVSNHTGRQSSTPPGCTDDKEGRPYYHTALLMMGHNDVFAAARACRVPERCSPPSSATAAMPPAVRCAFGALHRSLRQHLYNVSALLLAHAAAPPQLAQWWSAAPSSRRATTMPPPALVIGVNPTTGYPCLDVILGDIIVSVARELAAASTTEPAGTEVTWWHRRVALATFPSFVKGLHTFDTTHPNAAGAALLAEGWFAAITGNS